MSIIHFLYCGPSVNFESENITESQKAERSDYIKCGSDALKFGLCSGVVVVSLPVERV